MQICILLCLSVRYWCCIVSTGSGKYLCSLHIFEFDWSEFTFKYLMTSSKILTSLTFLWRRKKHLGRGSCWQIFIFIPFIVHEKVREGQIYPPPCRVRCKNSPCKIGLTIIAQLPIKTLHACMGVSYVYTFSKQHIVFYYFILLNY